MLLCSCGCRGCCCGCNCCCRYSCGGSYGSDGVCYCNCADGVAAAAAAVAPMAPATAIAPANGTPDGTATAAAYHVRSLPMVLLMVLLMIRLILICETPELSRRHLSVTSPTHCWLVGSASHAGTSLCCTTPCQHSCGFHKPGKTNPLVLLSWMGNASSDRTYDLQNYGFRTLNKTNRPASIAVPKSAELHIPDSNKTKHATNSTSRIDRTAITLQAAHRACRSHHPGQ